MPYKDKNKRVEYAREYALKNRTYIYARTTQWRHNNKEKYLAQKNNYLNRIKEEVLTHYGNGKLACVRCGFADIRALSIDHIAGGGKRHSREIKCRITVWLKSHNFPGGYQTLCMNCQFIKKLENREQPRI